MAYSSRTDEFLVVFEADQPGSGVVNIRGTVVDAYTFSPDYEIVYVNRNSHQEHHPRVAYNSITSTFFAIWNNGTEEEDYDTTKKRSLDDEQSTSRYNTERSGQSHIGIEILEDLPKFISKRSVKDSITMPIIGQTINWENLQEKRQTSAAHFLSGTLLCASSSSTGPVTAATVPVTQLSKTNDTTVNTLIAFAVIFGVLFIILSILLIFFAIIKPNRERARAEIAKKYDPERDSEMK